MIKSFFKISTALATTYFIVTSLINIYIGESGFIGELFYGNTLLKFLIYGILITHITITSMSLSFHRFHTHKGVILNPILDSLMQLNLWFVGGMSKLDWVAVHIYHHAHSDKEKDPHSPVQKGLMHVLFLGVFDYAKARESIPVMKIKNTIKRNKLEQFIADNSLVGVIILTTFNLIMFGPKYGSILSLINFLVSPVFAVGGVNGFAHWWGYKNHNYHDNSKNLGFVFPLNFLICGELDHNNHHAHPKSCSFRHRWFEFDWGFFYINILKKIKLANIKHAYTPKTLKVEMSKNIRNLLEKDFRFQKRMEELANDLNTNYADLLKMIEDYLQGKKVKLTNELKDLISEAKHTFYANYRLGLRYN
jgi:stearoyl-CoA desaturase (delta-9 desaturase)